MTEGEAPAAEEQPEIEFKGQKFRQNPDVSDWDVMEFFSTIRAASQDPEAVGIDGMVVLHDFAIECVHPDDRDRFRGHARKQRIGAGDLLELILGKLPEETERPTQRSSDSSDGPTSTEQSAVSNSDAKVSRASGLEYLRDRPDLALIVHDSRKAG